VTEQGKYKQRPPLLLLWLLLFPTLMLTIGWIAGFPAEPTWESAGLAVETLLQPPLDRASGALFVDIALLAVLGFMIFKHPRRGLCALLVSVPWTLLVQVVGAALAIRWLEPDLYWGHTFTGLAALPFALVAGVASFIAAFILSGRSRETHADSQSAS
jgi:hypothetical protein